MTGLRSTPGDSLTDFGLWVGGVMKASAGAHDPIARNTMASQIVTHGRKTLKWGGCDLIVIAVPEGTGSDFMAKWVEMVGENPACRGTVDL